MKIVTTGSFAPDFTLIGTRGEDVNLSSFRGRPVLLVFTRGLG